MWNFTPTTCWSRGAAPTGRANGPSPMPSGATARRSGSGFDQPRLDIAAAGPSIAVMPDPVTEAAAHRRFSAVAIALHWIIAVLVAINLYFGLQFDDLRGLAKFNL